MEENERLTEVQIRAYLEHHAPEAARRKKLYDYYDGKHAINQRTFDDPSKPNNRVSHGYPKMIANMYAGYLLGEPVSYTASEGGEVLEANLHEDYDYNDEEAENAALALDLAICGVAVEILYMDADSHIRFTRVDPIGCIAVWDNSIEERLTALIRYYDVRDITKSTTTRWVEVYEAKTKRVYKSDNNGFSLTLQSDEPHYFNDVPAVAFKNNSRLLGDFECELSLIDAYDTMQSDAINDDEYFSDAYLMLKGMQGTESEDVAAMKEQRVMLLPNDGDAQWLIKQDNGTSVESIKTRLDRDIHRFSGCPDMTDESFAGNASGVAIKYKLLQFENVAKNKEREFKRGLQRRLELMCNMWAVLGRGSFDWRDISITFKRALPQNLSETASAMSALGSIISDETKRSLLPIDIDEDIEKQRLADEREAGMSLFQTNRFEASNPNPEESDLNE
jgi:SPP1 family phage portal protein